MEEPAEHPLGLRTASSHSKGAYGHRHPACLHPIVLSSSLLGIEGQGFRGPLSVATTDSERWFRRHWLEERYPEPPLYPHDAAARQRALALEDDLDETLGPALRAVIVTPLFRDDPDIALRVLTTGMPDQAYRTLRPLLRIFPAFYRLRHKISAANLEKDRAVVAAALDRIEQQRQGRAYLVGEAFTVADLTAAALMGPLLQPPEIQYPLQVELPSYLQEYRAPLMRHPAAQWAAGIYRLHRGQTAEVARQTAAA